MQVIKLIEGGYDLTSGEQIKIGIIVSNGKRELMIPVDEKVLGALINMHIESKTAKPRSTEDFSPAPTKEPTLAMPKLVPMDGPPAVPPEDFVFQSTEPEEVKDEEGFMPGEEYKDSGTGVTSL